MPDYRVIPCTTNTTPTTGSRIGVCSHCWFRARNTICFHWNSKWQLKIYYLAFKY